MAQFVKSGMKKNGHKTTIPPVRDINLIKKSLPDHYFRMANGEKFFPGLDSPID